MQSSPSVSDFDRRRAARERLRGRLLYDADVQGDACGVGLVAAIDGRPRRRIVALALEALGAVRHRGALDADGETGDGAGLLVSLPEAFVRARAAELGRSPRPGAIGVGQVFLPRTSLAAQDASRALVETELLRAEFDLLGWRQTPIEPSVLGDKAARVRPEIEQVFVLDTRDRCAADVERALYLARRRVETQARAANLLDLYVCSLSTRSLVYKGLVRAEKLGLFYPDLQRDDFEARAAIFHQRYSTNTFPEWRLAHPFRTLAHNGEINTLKGNLNWMRAHETRLASEAFGEDAGAVRPVVQPGSSDSAALDQVMELLVRAGRSAPMAKSLLIPEAWSKREGVMAEPVRALYAYANALIEPWDGPAAIAAFDGRWAILGRDRNGLRPMRWTRLKDEVLIAGSETGLIHLDDDEVVERGAVPSGGLVAIDLDQGRMLETDEITAELAADGAFDSWLKNLTELDDDLASGPTPAPIERTEFRRRVQAVGVTREDLELIVRPMAETGKEAVGSMGDDVALAVLSEGFRPLSHFFRQNFAQVTNPPIDPVREERVMSLKTRFRNHGNILDPNADQTTVQTLESPILTNAMAERFADTFADEIARIDCTFARPQGATKGRALEAALERIAEQAEAAVDKDGFAHVVLCDRAQSRDRVGAPAILAAGYVHKRLIEAGARNRCSIHVRSSETFDAHAAAVLIGVGATTVNPYLLMSAASSLAAEGRIRQSAAQAEANVKAALDAGLLKIMAKLGVSIISSYRGAAAFEALGLSRTVVRRCFLGVSSRLSGLGFAGIESRRLACHAEAWDADEPAVAPGGFYRWRPEGQRHVHDAAHVDNLQRAVRENDVSAYQRFAEEFPRTAPMQLRDLLDATPLGPAVFIDEVESANALRKRFVTPGMSLGALSPEAHETLAAAMNRIGARSVSGEGGEDLSRSAGLDENRATTVKQIASGRFGVTAAYLNACEEIEIKVAQGAKPGEGGQLPGFKVTELIARLRHSTPGVTLISPPPHHDIYSIEDLAQLIYDLKQVNPIARVAVKLVAGAGIGAVAVGVAKAHADIIGISGHTGGTGASPQTSIKFAGLPWEMGLAEAQQALILNGLRDRVRLRVDGGIRTGRDVIFAALLGGEEFGVGTAALVALGCLMVRQCHSNTCPVGVCTQDESLRERFVGKSEHVVRLMTFIAQDVRERLAALGAKSLDEIVGRADLLRQVARGPADLDDLDLNPLIVHVDPGAPTRGLRPAGRTEVADTLDAEILNDARAFFERGEAREVAYPIRNHHRAVGARCSSAIVKKWGPDGAPADRLVIRLSGSAGQSLGAFSARGLRIELDGDANDYVGKGLSGATIVIRSIGSAATDRPEMLIGNTCLYGATSGALFAAGRAGERFAVRNSGAVAVIEGCGANGCEYMTGGTVVILGAIGDNFAAGMTGGRVYLLDSGPKPEPLINPDSVIWGGLQDAEAEAEVKAMVERHAAETGSLRAKMILERWSEVRDRIVEITPKDVGLRAASAAVRHAAE